LLFVDIKSPLLVETCKSVLCMCHFGPTWTFDPVVKPFGCTMKKEAGKDFETSEEKDEEFPREKDEEFPREYRTLHPVYINP